MDPDKTESPRPTTARPPSLALTLGANINVPLIYADQLVDVQYGAFTSKILFGVEHGQTPTPALQVVMPTPMLLQAAVRLVSELTAKDMVGFVDERFKELIKYLEQYQHKDGDVTSST